jgi:hypothetical protein
MFELAGAWYTVAAYEGEHLLLDEAGPLDVARLEGIARTLIELVMVLHDRSRPLGTLDAAHVLVSPEGAIRLFDPDVRRPPLRSHLGLVTELLRAYAPDPDQLLSHVFSGIPLTAAPVRHASITTFDPHEEPHYDARAIRPTARAALHLIASADSVRGAQTAVEALAGPFADYDDGDPTERFEDAVRTADMLVRVRRERASFVAVLIVDRSVAYAAYVGFCPLALLYRAGTVHPLAPDWTRRRGLIIAEEARNPRGGYPVVLGDGYARMRLIRVSLEPGDRLVLSTEALWGVPGFEIASALGTYPDPHDAVQVLVRTARRAVTASVVDP